MNNNPQEVILYRGWHEYAMGQAMQSGLAFIIFCAIAAFFAAFFVAQWGHQKLLASRGRYRFSMDARPSLFCGAIAAIAVVMWLI